MGSRSDWSTMEPATRKLDSLGIEYEVKVLSAHRTPDQLAEWAETAAERGLKVIIAGAGMAAALPGAVAAKTQLPVLGVPVQSKALGGLDALLAMSQMPPGIPVGTLAIGEPGASNAAILAASILALGDPEVSGALAEMRAAQTAKVLEDSDPRT